jgi:hypothetical protein
MTDDDDIGTARWFGQTWGAPVCDPRAHVEAPVGEPCLRCHRPIEAGDQGVTIPYGTVPAPWHLDCWLREIGAPVTAEVLGDE